MYVQNKNKIHFIITILVIALYFFSPKTGINLVTEEVSAKETRTETGKVSTGMVQKVQTGGRKTETKGKIGENKILQGNGGCFAECKIKKLIELGMNERIAGSLVMTCKNTAKDPVNCIKIGASISISESGGGKRCNKNGCFGILSGGIPYNSIEKGVEDWVRRYNMFWFNQRTPSSFYNNIIGEYPITGYCNSEPDTDIEGYCPNGYKNSWNVFNKLDF